ncbi:MAG TPA: hypothetical protein VMV05_08430 [bacterium]|nr:hypothetical protein [bacterium]
MKKKLWMLIALMMAAGVSNSAFSGEWKVAPSLSGKTGSKLGDYLKNHKGVSPRSSSKKPKQ